MTSFSLFGEVYRVLVCPRFTRQGREEGFGLSNLRFTFLDGMLFEEDDTSHQMGICLCLLLSQKGPPCVDPLLERQGEHTYPVVDGGFCTPEGHLVCVWWLGLTHPTTPSLDVSYRERTDLVPGSTDHVQSCVLAGRLLF